LHGLHGLHGCGTWHDTTSNDEQQYSISYHHRGVGQRVEDLAHPVPLFGSFIGRSALQLLHCKGKMQGKDARERCKNRKKKWLHFFVKHKKEDIGIEC
jgi:hypothetical protein